jgi:pimeloyl-ACP methyl ester carboxylesterase
MHCLSLHGIVCVLGTFLLADAARAQDSTWRDPASHRSGHVRSNGARIHYLEWPSDKSPIVLLPGYSLTAHVYDSLAALLHADHRVVAITPRGFGESDAPDSSEYTLATGAADLATVLQSLGIRRATLVGHSMGGAIIARFALDHAERVDRLIFLDAFPYFAAEGGDSVDARNPIEVPPFVGDTTHDNVAPYLAKYHFVPWNRAFEADLRAKPTGAESWRRRAVTMPYIEDQWAHPPDLTRLTVPSLQICAVPTVASEYPWISRDSARYSAAEGHVEQSLKPFNDRLCDRYARTVPRGKVARLTGSHYLFFGYPELAARVIRDYLDR